MLVVTGSICGGVEAIEDTDGTDGADALAPPTFALFNIEVADAIPETTAAMPAAMPAIISQGVTEFLADAIAFDIPIAVFIKI